MIAIKSGEYNSQLHKQSPPTRTVEIQPAQAGFVCVDAISIANNL